MRSVKRIRVTSNDSGDGLAEPHIWQNALPVEVFDGLREWASAQPFTINHVRRLAGGRSGSYVAVVRIIPDRGIMRQAVLKVVPPKIAAIESRGVKLAHQHTPPAFWEAHMVPTSDQNFLPSTRWCVHLQETASADLTALHTLAELLDTPHFAEHCATIIGAIVSDWHQSDDPAPLFSTTQAFLAGFLKKHQEGLDDFALKAGLRRDEPADAVHVPGRAGPLPNPFGLLQGLPTDDFARVRDGRAEVYLANGHGDLQLFNVLIPYAETIDAQAFRLIDYGRFSPLTPVSRDPIKLLLSIAGAWLARPEFATGTDLRSRLAEVVAAPRATVAGSLAGYAVVARRIHDAAGQWGVRRSMLAEWQRQHLLVLIGSALRLVADRDLAQDDRWWFFEVAALATRAYAQPEAAASPPAHAAVLAVERPVPTAPERHLLPDTTTRTHLEAPSPVANVIPEVGAPSPGGLRGLHKTLIAVAVAVAAVMIGAVLMENLPAFRTTNLPPLAVATSGTPSADGSLGPDPRWTTGPTAGAVSVASPAPDARVDACVRLRGTARGLASDETLVIAMRRADRYVGQPFAYYLVHDWDTPSSLTAWTAEVSLGPAVNQKWDLIVLIAGLEDIRREKVKPSRQTIATFRHAAGVTVEQESAEHPC